MSGQGFVIDPRSKKISIPVRVVGGTLVFFYGGPLPRLHEGTIGDLVVLDSALEDRALASTLNEPKDLFLLPKGATLRVLLRNETATEQLPRLDGPEIIAPYVEVLLAEDLRLEFRGTRHGRLIGGRCEILDLGKSAESLNEAYTLVSIAFEPTRRSHTGNVFQAIAFQDATSGRWHRLEHLRQRLEGRWEAESLGPDGS